MRIVSICTNNCYEISNFVSTLTITVASSRKYVNIFNEGKVSYQMTPIQLITSFDLAPIIFFSHRYWIILVLDWIVPWIVLPYPEYIIDFHSSIPISDGL